MLPSPPQRSHHLRRHRPAGGARCGDLAGPHIPRSLGGGAWWPVLSAFCCVHTPTSRAAFSGEPGGRAKALGGKSLPWGCLGWRPNQECVDTPLGSGGLLGK